MFEFSRTDGTFAVLVIALIAGTLRMMVGIWKPQMPFVATLVIGLTTAVFLVPTLHQWRFEQPLLNTPRKKLCHALAMGICGLFFLEYVVSG